MARAYGRRVGREKETMLQQLAREMCHWTQSSFPGSHPVSLTNENIGELLRSSYVACEKSDGERLMLLIHEGSTYIFGRNFEMFDVNIRFPGEGGRAHHMTLLDGEIVVDKAPKEGDPPIHRYLVYDAVQVLGQDLCQEHLLSRLKTAFEKVVAPKEKVATKKEPFQIFLKDFFEVWQSRAIMNFAEHLPHESDGIIFTPVCLPYVPGTCKELLKWKPPHLNTIDFQLHMIYGGRTKAHVRLLSAAKGKVSWTGELFWLAQQGVLWQEAEKNLSDFNGKIVECCWDENAVTFLPKESDKFSPAGEHVLGGWVMLRIRADKTLPNDISVVQKVRQSIEDGIDIDYLDDKLNVLQYSQTRGVAAEFTTAKTGVKRGRE